MAKHTTTTHKGTQAAQQAPATTTPAAPAANATPVNSALAVVYKAGKPYNVRPGTAQANDRSWQAIQAALQAAGGQCDRAALQKAVEPFNHVPFVGYCIRRGWLAQA